MLQSSISSSELCTPTSSPPLCTLITSPKLTAGARGLLDTLRCEGKLMDTHSSKLKIPFQKDVDWNWLVMKFGGTSLGNLDRLWSCVNIIKSHTVSYRPIVVCSALSAHTKAQGTTSQLLSIAQNVLEWTDEEVLNVLQPLKHYHEELIESIFHSCNKEVNKEKEKQSFLSLIQHEMKKLLAYVHALQVIQECSPRSLDVIVSTGEKLACIVVEAALHVANIPSLRIPLDTILESSPTTTPCTPSVSNPLFYSNLTTLFTSLFSRLSSSSPASSVIIVTGFLGPFPDSFLTTVGRGYSDYTASLLALSLHLNELHVWKELQGIFTTDPSLCPTAQWIPFLSIQEALELTSLGSQVVHPFTLAHPSAQHLKVRVRHVQSPEHPGTWVLPFPSSSVSKLFQSSNVNSPKESTTLTVDTKEETSTSPCTTPLIQKEISTVLPSPPSPSSSSFSSLVTNVHATEHLDLLKSNFFLASQGRPTAITLKTNIFVFNLQGYQHRFSCLPLFEQVFHILNQFKVQLDLICTSQSQISMAIAASELTPQKNSTLNSPCFKNKSTPVDPTLNVVEGLVQELQQLGSVTVLSNQVILSIVGQGLKHSIGAAGRFFKILADEQINIEMISQGASEINISCVIAQQDALRALNRVHDQMILPYLES